MSESQEGYDTNGGEIRMVALCADCGCMMVEGHPRYPPLCRSCGDGFDRLMQEQRRVLAGKRTDWPGECHVDAQCGAWSEERERAARSVREVLSQLWQKWQWWFEGDEGAAA